MWLAKLTIQKAFLNYQRGKLNMSKRKKSILILSVISAFCLIVSTVAGVVVADKVANVKVGGTTATPLVELDAIPTSEKSVVNILLFGVDEGGMRSDTIMLMSINGYTNEVNVLSIPRDTRIPVGKGYQKVNAAIGIGAQEVRKGSKNDNGEAYKEPEDYAIKKIKALTGLPIHYFMTIDFEGFKDIIDVLGGVDFNVPFRMKYDDPIQNLHIDLQPGMQHLDGQAAHDFVRFRQGNRGYQGYAMGDLGRIEAQQAFLKAIVEQKVNAEYIGKATELFEIICKYVKTNYAVKDLLRHLGVATKLNSDAVNMHQLPGYSKTIGGVSYFICDEAGTEELVNTVFASDRQTPLPVESEDGEE